MMDTFKLLPTPQPIFYDSKWVRAEAGGILITKVKLGASVKEGDILAEVVDPVTNVVHQTVSPMNGTILGRAQNQFVSPGFALFNVGIPHTVEELKQQIRSETAPTTE